MTAEIAILNRQAIALASDSAVTVGRKRVWKHTNKLFSLGPTNDIGIMVYNTGDFLGISWEVIVKEFRRKNNKKFKTVNDCAQSFVNFLSDETLGNEYMESLGACLVFVHVIESLRKEIKTTKKSEFSAQIQQHVKRDIEKLSKISELDISINEDDFKKSHSKNINMIAKDVFGARLSKEAHSSIVKLAYEHFIRQSPSGFFTGVVVAGFGTDELFPSIQHYIVDGRTDSVTRVWRASEKNLNKAGRQPALIMGFAQSDLMHGFMEGIIPGFLSYISRYLRRVLDDKSEALIKDYISGNDERVVELSRQKKDNEIAANEFEEGFRKYRQKALVNPVLNVVQSLPKEEMAAMAEALVELTALRRKVDSPLETVAGPTDVAVISK